MNAQPSLHGRAVAAAPPSNGAEQQLSPTVITAAESKAIVTKCGERIDGYNALLDRQERLTDVVRLAIGLELAIAKPHLEHGEFQPFIEKRLPRYGYRTAARWMEFAQLVIDKSDPGSLLKKLPEKALNGGIHEEELAPVAKQLDLVTEGLPHDEFVEKFAEKKPKGGLRKVKFHCPHCSTENTGLFGRTVKCISCKKEIVAKPDVDPEADTKRRAEAVNNNLHEIKAAIVTYREASKDDIAHASTDAFNDALREAQWLVKHLLDAKRLRAATKRTRK